MAKYIDNPPWVWIVIADGREDPDREEIRGVFSSEKRALEYIKRMSIDGPTGADIRKFEVNSGS